VGLLAGFINSSLSGDTRWKSLIKFKLFFMGLEWLG